jgi:hypothetical protein
MEFPSVTIIHTKKGDSHRPDDCLLYTKNYSLLTRYCTHLAASSTRPALAPLSPRPCGQRACRAVRS